MQTVLKSNAADLAEFVAVHTREHVSKVLEVYAKTFGGDVPAAVKLHTKGLGEALLLALLGGSKKTASKVNVTKAHADVRPLSTSITICYDYNKNNDNNNYYYYCYYY